MCRRAADSTARLGVCHPTVVLSGPATRPRCRPAADLQAPSVGVSVCLSTRPSVCLSDGRRVRDQPRAPASSEEERRQQFVARTMGGCELAVGCRPAGQGPEGGLSTRPGARRSPGSPGAAGHRRCSPHSRGHSSSEVGPPTPPSDRPTDRPAPQSSEGTVAGQRARGTAVGHVKHSTQSAEYKRYNVIIQGGRRAHACLCCPETTL